MASFGTSLDDIKKAVRSWRPGDAKTEKQCRDSLAQLLEKRFPKADVIKEYGRGRLRVDVYVKFGQGLSRAWHGEHQCFIEVKYGLRSRSALQRAIGQLDQYMREKALPCVFVVCGAQDRNTLRDLERAIKDQNDRFADPFGFCEPVALLWGK